MTNARGGELMMSRGEAERSSSNPQQQHRSAASPQGKQVVKGSGFRAVL